MSDKCSFRECPPRSAIELLKEAEERKKKREEKTTTGILGRGWTKHSTGTEFQEEYLR